MANRTVLKRLRDMLDYAVEVCEEADSTAQPVRPDPPPLRNRTPLPIVAADGRDTVGEDSQDPELTRSALLERLAGCRTRDDVDQVQRWIEYANADSQIGWDDLQTLRRAVADRLAELRHA